MIKQLSGQMKTSKTAEILSAIIQQYINITKNLTVVLIDDLQVIVMMMMMMMIMIIIITTTTTTIIIIIALTMP